MQSDSIQGFRLSSQQRQLWALGGGAAYQAAIAVQLEGELDAAALERALHRVARRHEILRTRFASVPGMQLPIQAIEEDPRLVLQRAVRAPEEDPDAPWRRALDAPFDPERLPLLRCTLVEGPHAELLIALPALCADVATLHALLREIAAAYAAELSGETPAGEGGEVVQYVDVSEWQSELAESAEAEGGREHWRGQERSGLPVARLPYEQPAPAGPFRLEELRLAVAPALVESLKRLARDREVSLDVVLLAGLQSLLWRLAGRPEQVVVELLHSGRGLEQLAGTLGLFARYLPARARVDEDSQFREVVAAAGEGMVANDTWQDLYARPAGGEPAVQLEAIDWPEPVEAGPVRLKTERVFCCTDRCKLRLTWINHTAGVELVAGFDPRRLRESDVRRLAHGYLALLASAAAQPEATVSDLEILGAEERDLVLFGWNDTAAPMPAGVCLPDLFAAQAGHTPDAPAVVGRGESLSFADLERQANQLAWHLRGLGVGPEARVALCLERSAAMITALLATWKAGGAYVPLDPGLPAERLRFLLADTAASVLVTTVGLAASLGLDGARTVCLDRDREEIARHGDRLPVSGVLPDNLAYVLYTSGSTGRPKGVMVRHSSLVNLLAALDLAVYGPVDRQLRIGLNAPLAFDASVKQIVQLCRGRALHLLAEEVRFSGEKLLAQLAREPLDGLDCTPTQLRMLLAAGLRDRPDLVPAWLLVGGEPVDEAIWRYLAALPEGRACDVYGPTECTVDAAICRMADSPEPQIGRPVANARIYLLDDRLRPVPVGAAGEILIGGAGLARGYLGRPELTAERFVPDPFGSEPGARLYRSGDLGRFRPDGGIEFLGRADHQVKVRGVRVELGEIEAVVAEHPGVREAVVALLQDPAGEPRLAAYVVPARKYAPQIDGRARHRLPNGMAVVEQNRNETEYLFREIFQNAIYVQHGIELPEDACVLDVGGNIGMFSLFVSRLRPEARIYAFEPIAPLFESLRINTELYAPNVKAFPFGLGDRERTETFAFYPRYTMMSGLSAYAAPDKEVEVVKQYLRNERAQGAEGRDNLLTHADELLEGRFEAESRSGYLRRLSDVLREEGLRRVDLLKIDVQRAELDVLRGIDSQDWDKIQQIVLEVHDEESAAGGPIQQIRALLEGQGFEVLAEQDELLRGTDRFNVFAVRPAAGRRLRREPAPAAFAAAALEPAGDVPVPLSADLLRAHLRRKLPESMVPQVFVLLDSLPTTHSGKVDRKALPAPESLDPALRPQYAPPGSRIERVIAEIWSRVLNLEKPGIHDNFFDLGGHSLHLVQVHEQLREALSRELSMLELFERPTIRSLADFLAQGEGAPPPAGGDDVDERARLQAQALRRQRERMQERIQNV